MCIVYRNTVYSFYVGDTLLATDIMNIYSIIYSLLYTYNKNFVSEDFYM